MLLQDISLPPDIRDNLERCAAALEAAAVAAGATLPSAAAKEQPPHNLQTAQPQSRMHTASQAQPDVGGEANGSGASAGAAHAAIKTEAPSDSAAVAADKQAVQQDGSVGIKKKKRKHGQPPALAAPDAQPALPEAVQPPQKPATDAAEQPAGQPGKKKHKKRRSTDDADAAGPATAGRSREQAAAPRGAPADTTEAGVQTSVPPKKKRKKDKSATAEQQDQMAAHGGPAADVQQAVNGSTGKKQKKMKMEVGT